MSSNTNKIINCTNLEATGEFETKGVTVAANTTILEGTVLAEKTDGTVVIFDLDGTGGSNRPVFVANQDIENDTGSQVVLNANVFIRGTVNAEALVFADDVSTNIDSIISGVGSIITEMKKAGISVVKGSNVQTNINEEL